MRPGVLRKIFRSASADTLFNNASRFSSNRHCYVREFKLWTKEVRRRCRKLAFQCQLASQCAMRTAATAPTLHLSCIIVRYQRCSRQDEPYHTTTHHTTPGLDNSCGDHPRRTSPIKPLGRWVGFHALAWAWAELDGLLVGSPSEGLSRYQGLLGKGRLGSGREAGQLRYQSTSNGRFPFQ